MPIFFKPSASDFSLSADSIGNRWLQEPVVRPNGFPLYHWIQTERGEGLLTLEGQKLLLKPGDGVLIAPHVPHEYRENDGSGMWFTSFLTFDGKLSDDLYKICAVSPYLFVPASEGAWFQEWIDRIIDSHFLKNDIDDAALSVGCFEFLTRLSQLRTGLSRTEHPLYLQYVRPAMQEIESHLSDPINVDDLAEQLHITPQYLTRLFSVLSAALSARTSAFCASAAPRSFSSAVPTLRSTASPPSAATAMSATLSRFSASRPGQRRSSSGSCTAYNLKHPSFRRKKRSSVSFHRRRIFFRSLLFHAFQNASRNRQSVCACLLEAAGYGCAVADGAEAFDAGAEVFVYDNFVGIEFDFYAVQQCLIAGDTRCYFVEGFDHLGNVDHDTVREYQGKVARNGIF